MPSFSLLLEVKQIILICVDYFSKYGIIILVESPAVKWTAKSVSNSNGVTTISGYAETHSHSYKENHAIRIQSI